MALRILEQLKRVFSVKDWRVVTQFALAQKEFLVNPFLTRLHELEKMEKEQEMTRTRAPQPAYAQGQRGYRSNQPTYASRRASEQEEKREEDKKMAQSIHALMEAARQQNMQ